MKNLTFITLLLFITLSTCKKEEETIFAIDPAFQEYVDRFYEEAALRDIKLVKENLEVVFKDLEMVCGLGYKNYENTGLRRVEINTSTECWVDRSDLAKEALMFHELGHAVLRRPHLNFTLPNGSEKSMMCGTPNGCSLSGNYNKHTTPEVRDYYLTELFDKNTPTPDWAKEKNEETTILKSNFETPDTNWTFIVGSADIDPNYTNQIIQNDDEGKSYASIISKEALDNNVFAGWRYTIKNPPFYKEGGTIKLKANISGKDIAGEGISVVLRTDSGPYENREISGFSSTEGDILISGTFENMDYSAKIGYYPSDVSRIAIFVLMLGGTKGEVQINDVELTYLE